MSGRKRRPFGDALEIERGGDEPSGPRILSVAVAIGLIHTAVYFWW